MVSAQIKMKALVVSRLMMGDITNWTTFERERVTASQIANRRTARSVSSQIGRGYRELSKEIQNFIANNFIRCELAESVKHRVPFYADVHISPYGLKFEFPEHHFLRDMETSLPELLETRSRLASFSRPEFDSKRQRDLVGRLVAKEKFLSRSIISATFSFAEAFLSGLFFTAIHTNLVGCLVCDEGFQKYAGSRESAPLRDRLDRIVRFVSKDSESGADEPFRTFLETGKLYRDAIRHTTPFGRKDIEPGGRLTALYQINRDIALRCVVLSSATILKISQWTNPASGTTEIATRCRELITRAVAGHLDGETQRAMA